MSDPGRREVAQRMFAAEFEDTELSYSESDEERAPNYVVTPTGARVNRLFVAGVLTEVEPVNDDMLRARVADPSGAFVTYAGQYQPDERTFLDQTSQPTFIGLTGKARTFEPDDADQVYSSVRPESINEVDMDTRDRWTVDAAEATLQRLAVFREAIESDLRGDQLRAALAAGGAPGRLADGIPRALDHYETTVTYLEAVRRLAVEALELVAGDRDAVSPLETNPGDEGAVQVGPLPVTDISVDTAAAERLTATTTDAAEAIPGTTGPGASESGSVAGADDAVDASGTDATSADPESASPTDTAPTAGGRTAEAGGTDGSQLAESDSPASSETGVDAEAETDVESALETSSPESQLESSSDTASETGDDVGVDTEETDGDSGLGDFDADAPGLSNSPEDGGSETETAQSPDAEPDTEPAAEAESTRVTDSSPADADPAESTAGDPATSVNAGTSGEETPAPGEMYELDETERQEIEDQYDTGFSTGTEVDDAGEADIDVPSPDELNEQLREEASTAGQTEPAEETSDAPTDPVAETGPAPTEPAEESSGAPAGPAGETDDADGVETSTSTRNETAESTDGEPTEPDASTDSTEDVDSDDDEPAANTTESVEGADLEAAVVELMSELDDGSGASRETVQKEAADRYGADISAINEAIEGALMSGKCYEPGEGALKPI